MRHPFTRRNNAVAMAGFALLGVAAVLAIDDSHTGTLTFLTVTAVQGWTFTVFYGVASTWRATAAARALFWIVLTYAAAATHILITKWTGYRPPWADDLRQILYLGLALAAANLMLTTVRLVLDGRRASDHAR